MADLPLFPEPQYRRSRKRDFEHWGPWKGPRTTCKAKAHQPCRSLKNARVTDTHVARLEPQEVHPATCTQCSTIDTRGTDHPDYGWLCAVCSHRQYSKDEGWRTNYK